MNMGEHIEAKSGKGERKGAGKWRKREGTRKNINMGEHNEGGGRKIGQMREKRSRKGREIYAHRAHRGKIGQWREKHMNMGEHIEGNGRQR